MRYVKIRYGNKVIEFYRQIGNFEQIKAPDDVTGKSADITKICYCYLVPFMTTKYFEDKTSQDLIFAVGKS